jgi:hypothetical protein
LPAEPTTAGSRTGRVRRALLSILLLALVAVSWSGLLDQAALSNTDVTFKRALAAFAVSRGLNGVISVAQGTEIAIQPVGVGVTLTVGEILDPLNDLVERFSWLVLLACASLGTQMLLAEIMGNLWLSVALTATALPALAALWWPERIPGSAFLLRLCVLAVFVRFVFAAVSLTTAWVDHAVLAERQESALAQISQTRERIETLNQQTRPLPGETEESMLDRFSAFLDDQRRAMNIEARLAALSDRVESAINELIRLIVIFTVQTILVPVTALWAALAGFRWSWSRLWDTAQPS